MQNPVDLGLVEELGMLRLCRLQFDRHLVTSWPHVRAQEASTWQPMSASRVPHRCEHRRLPRA